MEAMAARQTQVFMEAPYRNNQLLDDILKNCQAQARLCIAANISAKNESIRTRTVKEWMAEKPDLHKQPVIFVMGTI
jgi:16S rRNA (cytidine1402-2'-O)-methyltransferase